MIKPELHIAEALQELQEYGLGNDLVYMPDFSNSFNETFRKRVYNDAEIEYCESFNEPLLRFASTWAAKEAVYKAVKQVYSGALPVSKIGIIRDKPAGKPVVSLPAELDGLSVNVSISHDGDYVWAIALVKHNH